MRRFLRPGEQQPGVHAVVVALEGARELVGLKAADHADQQVLDINRRAAQPLDHEALAVPGLEPELAIRSARIAPHVGEQAGELVGDQQRTAGLGLQQHRQPLDRAVGDVEARRHEGARLDGACRHGWRGLPCRHRFLDLFLPLLLLGLCGLGLGVVLALQLEHPLLAGALDHGERALGHVDAGGFSRAGEPDQCAPQCERLRP